ncbi:MAG TPA: 50S ribosomal protein L10 [Dehalococcoidia bacterium]|nr:50S ribosomal protein L10 [Dehalococcoidia bacterium]
MPTQRKIDQVEDLKQRMERATITVSANYRGLRVQEMDQMRKRMRAASIEVRVVKNSLLRLAAGQTGAPELMQIVEGPTALVISYDDPIEAAKAITEYAQSAPPTFSLRGAFLDGHVVSAADLRDLVRLPPRPVMLAQLAGQIQAPLATLSGLLQSHLRELTSLLQSVLSELPGLIDARARQLEATGGPAQAAAEAPAETAAKEESPVDAAEEPAPEATPDAGEEPAEEPTSEQAGETQEESAAEEQPEQQEE